MGDCTNYVYGVKVCVCVWGGGIGFSVCRQTPTPWGGGGGGGGGIGFSVRRPPPPPPNPRPPPHTRRAYCTHVLTRAISRRTHPLPSPLVPYTARRFSQVEHPVTEGITGVNLPACQLLVGCGVPLTRIPYIRALYGRDPRGAEPFDLETTPQRPPEGHVVAVGLGCGGWGKGWGKVFLGGGSVGGCVKQHKENVAQSRWLCVWRGGGRVGSVGGGMPCI